MTKTIRIENADKSNHKVRIFVENKGIDGEWQREPHALQLDYPTAMQTQTIHGGKRLVIEEI